MLPTKRKTLLTSNQSDLLTFGNAPPQLQTKNVILAFIYEVTSK